MLLERNYKSSTVDAAIRRARAIPRWKALQRVANPNHSTRPVYAVTWDPRLPNLSSMTSKHWRSMTLSSPYLKEVYPEPPLVAYRRQKNVKDFLIRAKVPPPPQIRPKRKIPGMKKCQKCVICPFIKEGKTVKGPNFTWKLNEELNCSTQNIIYMIECNLEKCKQKYIGESERTLHERISEHVGYVRTKKTNLTTGQHFNKPGHSLGNMTVTILKKVKSKDPFYRKERETYYIRKFNTFYRGLNLRP
jgi:hypothetical protein